MKRKVFPTRKQKETFGDKGHSDVKRKYLTMCRNKNCNKKLFFCCEKEHFRNLSLLEDNKTRTTSFHHEQSPNELFCCASLMNRQWQVSILQNANNDKRKVDGMLLRIMKVKLRSIKGRVSDSLLEVYDELRNC
ncbi:CLUMA_CG021583, isoform A [Clunio marinus]|uniref:CLUMA_CG021583, isoform A n=1 Tax=Clunio marinus TaxID=568069 RepID=A0A1J1JBR9_9DIPT|nr:CLUMA_CG021583, isoform A [Clunio marinus]